MRREVVVAYGPGEEVEILVHGQPWAPERARQWLDEQFVANECEPLRASGKVLTADKVLALAEAVGPERLRSDGLYAEAFADAVVAALGQAVVRVDVEGRGLTF